MSNSSRASITLQAEDRFSRVFQDLDRRLQGSNRVVDAMQRSVGALGVSFGALAGGISVVAGLVAGLKLAADGLDKLNDAADATGSSIEKLSALEDIGNRTGTGFDTVTAALLRFNQQLQAAQDGGEGPAQVLRSIGLEASRLAALDPADALKQVADAFAQYADDGDKARAVQELFGKSVREVAPFLKDLAEAQELQGRVTAEQTAEAEAFNRALTTMQAEATNLGRAFASVLLPGVNKLLAEMRDGIKVFGSLGAAIRTIWLGTNPFESQAEAIARVRENIEELEQRYATLQKRYRDPNGGGSRDLQERINREKQLLAYLQLRQAAEVPQASYSNEGRLPTTLPSLKIDSRPVQQARIEVDRLRDSIGRVRVGTDSIRLTDSMFDAIPRAMERAQAEADEAAEGLGFTVRQLNASLSADDRERGAVQIEIERSTLQRRIDELRIGGADVLAAQEQLNNLVLLRQAELAEDLKPGWQRMLDDWSLISNDMGAQFDRVMDGVVVAGEDAIAEFIQTGRINLQSFSDAVTQVIARLIAQQLTLKAFGLAGDAFIGLTGGFALAKGGAFDGAGAPVRFAQGGVFGDMVSSPTLFGFGGGRRRGLMGEAGPEAVMPLERGADGRLGVRASGDRGRVINMNVTVQATPGMTRDTALQQGYRVGQGIQRAMARSA